jgi:hypothetical protein
MQEQIGSTGPSGAPGPSGLSTKPEPKVLRPGQLRKYTPAEQLEIKIAEAAMRFYEEVRKQGLDPSLIESFEWRDSFITDTVRDTISNSERRKKPNPYRRSVNVAIMKIGDPRLIEPPIEKPVVPKLKKYLKESESLKKLIQAKPQPEPPKPRRTTIRGSTSLAMLQAMAAGAREITIDVKEVEVELDRAG